METGLEQLNDTSWRVAVYWPRRGQHAIHIKYELSDYGLVFWRHDPLGRGSSFEDASTSAILYANHLQYLQDPHNAAVVYLTGSNGENFKIGPML